MNTPLITWGCIVTLFIIIMSVQLLNQSRLHLKRNHQKVLEFGSEREEFFIRGDPNPIKSEDYDYEDSADC